MGLAHNIDNVKRTQDVQISENITFDTLLLSSRTLDGLKKAGFEKPSPIQLHGIPLGKCGFDLLLEAKSGTGKTAVFTVITLEKLDLSQGLQTIILAPTREIASQISDVVRQIGSCFEGLKVEVVMGGLPLQEDIDKFKDNNVHILVGSPGRVKHLIQDQHIDISSVRLLILDEADKLMDRSFQSDIYKIFTALPNQKQIIMSSATYPEYCKTFINNYVNNAQSICPDTNNVLKGILQKITVVKSNSNIVRQMQYKMDELNRILTINQFKQCLIFCNYQNRVAQVHKLLVHKKWPAEQLHGSQQQLDRLNALKTLQDYKCRILISTDLAARGIDASNVDLVINLDTPLDWQTYLHRIGRAGRYGSYGLAVSVLSEGKEVENFEKVIKSIKFPLNIRYLWTDESFLTDTKTQDPLVASTVVNKSNIEQNYDKDSINEILGKLIESKELTISKLENLNKLSELNKKNVKLETFAELVSSFENFTESQYQRDIPYDKYSESLSSEQYIEEQCHLSCGDSTKTQDPLAASTVVNKSNIEQNYDKDTINEILVKLIESKEFDISKLENLTKLNELNKKNVKLETFAELVSSFENFTESQYQRDIPYDKYSESSSEQYIEEQCHLSCGDSTKTQDPLAASTVVNKSNIEQNYDKDTINEILVKLIESKEFDFSKLENLTKLNELNKKNVKLETFAELVSSFENFTESQYQRDIPYDKYSELSSSEQYIEEQYHLSCGNSNSVSDSSKDEEKYIFNEQSVSLNKIINSKEHENNSVNNLIDSDSASRNCFDMGKSKATEFTHENYMSYNDTYKVHNTNNSESLALERAGLPTSFGGAKYKNKSQSERKKLNKSKINSIKNHNELLSDVVEYKTEQQKTVKNSLDATHTNEATDERVRSEETHDKNTECPQNESLSSERQNLNNNNYITWYRALKSRVKEYEMAIYINELSKK